LITVGDGLSGEFEHVTQGSDGSTDGAPRPVRWQTRALAMALACVLWGLAVCWYATTRVGVLPGGSGTPGEVLVTSCVQHGAARGAAPVTECTGMFRAAGGRVVDQDAPVPGDHHVGDVVRVDRTAGGGYATVSHRAEVARTVGTGAGVVLCGVGAVLLRTELRRRRTPVEPLPEAVAADPA
jgi:hypothetical protein